VYENNRRNRHAYLIDAGSRQGENAGKIRGFARDLRPGMVDAPDRAAGSRPGSQEYTELLTWKSNMFLS